MGGTGPELGVSMASCTDNRCSCYRVQEIKPTVQWCKNESKTSSRRERSQKERKAKWGHIPVSHYTWFQINRLAGIHLVRALFGFIHEKRTNVKLVVNSIHIGHKPPTTIPWHLLKTMHYRTNNEWFITWKIVVINQMFLRNSSCEVCDWNDHLLNHSCFSVKLQADAWTNSRDGFEHTNKPTNDKNEYDSLWRIMCNILHSEVSSHPNLTHVDMEIPFQRA